jgi:hypothetical protein
MRGFTDETTPYQICFESFGVVVRVCVSTPEMLEAVEPLMPPDRRPSDELLTARRIGIVLEDDGTYSVYNAGTRVNEGGGFELAKIVLEGQVRSYISLNAPDHVFVHAGVVGHEGRAIIVPGPSFTGKTTLTAALVRAGALYYSDEFAVLDHEGLVHPFAKTLSLRPEGVQIEHTVEEIGGTAGHEPLPIGLVVITHFNPGATWAPERLSGGTAVLEVLGNTVTMTERPEAAMRVVARSLRGVPVLKGERGEADDLAEELLDQLVEPVAD